MKDRLVKISSLRDKSVIETKEYSYACSGAKYSGEWLHGMRHGHGSMLWPDGATFEGNWSFNQPCGNGRFVYVSGDVY